MELSVDHAPEPVSCRFFPSARDLCLAASCRQRAMQRDASIPREKMIHRVLLVHQSQGKRDVVGWDRDAVRARTAGR
jgi:hypothetical protein